MIPDQVMVEYLNPKKEAQGLQWIIDQRSATILDLCNCKSTAKVRRTENRPLQYYVVLHS
jgi:hypothetical protein